MKENQSDKTEAKQNSPWWTKAKGLMKIAFSSAILLQPHYAFIIGMGTCTIGVAAHAYRKHPERSWSGFMSDLWHKPNEIWKDVKDAFAMEAGATLGLLAPYAGMAIAAFGAVSYLGGHAQGVEGIFKGAAMATTVGSVSLPIIAGAFMIEGLCNSLGYDVNIIERGFSLAKNMVQSVQKIMGVAEKNLEKPSVALAQTVKEVQQGKHVIAQEVQQVNKAIQPVLEQAKATVNEINETQKVMSFVERYTNKTKEILHLSKVDKVQNNQANPAAYKGKQ